jgi:hypothetical protein
MLLKFFHVHYTQVFCQLTLCKEDHVYLRYVMLQRQLSYLNGRKLDRRPVYTTCVFVLQANQSESHLFYEWRLNANQFVLAPSPSRITATDFFERILAVIVIM